LAPEAMMDHNALRAKPLEVRSSEGLGVILRGAPSDRPRQDEKQHEPNDSAERHGLKTFPGDGTIRCVEVNDGSEGEQIEYADSGSSVDTELEISPRDYTDCYIGESHGGVEAQEWQVHDVSRVGTKEHANANNHSCDTEQYCRNRCCQNHFLTVQVQQRVLR